MFLRDETIKKNWEHCCCKGEKGWKSKSRTVLCSRKFRWDQYEKDLEILEIFGYKNTEEKLKWGRQKYNFR